MIDIKKTRELLAAASPRPWKPRTGCYAEEPESYAMGPDAVEADGEEWTGDGSEQAHRDAELIAHAINVLPAMCGRIEELEAENAELRAAFEQACDVVEDLACPQTRRGAEAIATMEANRARLSK